jgi:hypothetical protein
MLETSKDGIDKIQAHRFARHFKLTNVRLEDGFWFADDGDCGPYKISADNYWGAKYDGDFR